MPHVVSLQKLKNVGGNGRWGDVNITDGRRMNLAVVSGALKRKPALYEGIGGIEVSLDVMRRCFMAVLLDAERDECGASIMFEARWCW
jgi:hypothetical protein